VKSIRYVNRFIKDYDILYGLPWPFIGQLMVQLLRKNKKATLIWNIQDLYPESFFLKIKSRFIRKVLQPFYSLDKFLAKKATHLTLVSDTIRRVYLEERNIPKDKLTVICNWQDESEFIKEIPSKEVLFEKYKLEILKDKFIFMYLGNIGPVAGVETIIEVFSKLNLNETALIIAGSGTSKNKCQTLARELNSANILFIDVPLGLRPVVELQSLSNVLLLPILPDAADSSIPSKLIAYMFSKKPIISSANELSETAIAIKESQCGWLTKSNKISDWIEVMTQAYKLPINILDEKGESGYSYAMSNYSKTEGLKKVNQLFINIKQ
jgi:glycosyltransferase involved in cell wall biosynthesis